MSDAGTVSEKVAEILRLANELSVFYRNREPYHSTLFYDANKILRIGWRMQDAIEASALEVPR